MFTLLTMGTTQPFIWYFPYLTHDFEALFCINFDWCRHLIVATKALQSFSLKQEPAHLVQMKTKIFHYILQHLRIDLTLSNFSPTLLARRARQTLKQAMRKGKNQIV
jgi:hypothetical protein